ncbi:MAG: hypothetical protein AAFV43_15240 [Planctomycetota bacterium]
MMSRVALLAAMLTFSAAVEAAPVLVQFVGEISHVGSEAPSSFYIGERVVGAFVYNPDAPYYLRVASPRNNSGFFDFQCGWTSCSRGSTPPSGALNVATASGFVAVDETTEFSWKYVNASWWNPEGAAANTLELGAHEEAAGLTYTPTLVTLSGPSATAMVIYFEPPTIDESQIDDRGFAPLAALAPVEPFIGLRSGAIGFDASGSAFNGFGGRSVGFDVTSFQVTQIPEPTAACLALVLVTTTALRKR